MINLFSRPKRYITPGGKVWKLYDDMSQQPHLLIAGETGSGKSVALNGVIHAILHRSPNSAQLILIDKKRVELLAYRDIPHTVRYAVEDDEVVQALNAALAITDRRYQDMARRRIKKYDGSDVYVIIDELGDLLTTQKRECKPLLQRLCMVGRAARVHLIGCTQRPTASIISADITVNIDARLALRTRNAQDSRNIIGVAGCETLPKVGKGYYLTADGLTLHSIPYVTDEELNELCDYWQSRRCYVA